MEEIAVVGGVPEFVENKDGVYQGDLVHYYEWIFRNATSLNNGYHNFGHLLRVAWLCYRACVYYGGRLSQRQKRNLLIAAIFHDVNHCGKKGDDGENIRRAIEALEIAILPADRPYLGEIANIIRMTEFPHKVETKLLPILGRILRDADVAQALDVSWVQEVVFGLAREWKMAPIEVMRNQIPFLEHLVFGSEWAQQTFPQAAIAAKIAEVRKHLAFLERRETNDEGAT
ncbi:MAG: HD domain-containing protein [Candidatus Pacebacteria bacterium]|jgi:hypothetical protein|nr:HD domain-containing protein [Candidatus Paceibacterota bacterium]